MLIITLSALVVSISLTVVLFALLGRVVYGRVLANGMRIQARTLAEDTVGLFEGSVTQESFRFMMRSSDSTVLVFDGEGQLVAASVPKNDDKKPDGAHGGVPPEIPDEGFHGGFPGGTQPGEEDRLSGYLEHCGEVFGAAMEAEPYSEYTEFSGSLGVVVALPVEDESGEKLGAVFLIKPINDIAETSQSVIIVLVIASVIVALLLVIPIYFVSKRLTKPLRDLNATASAFAEGDLSVRVSPEGTREISELSETFNGLADNLERNINELVIERNRLSAVLDGLSEGLIAFGSNGELIKNNSSASILLGGEPGSDLRSLPHFTGIAAAAASVMETGISSIDALDVGERVIRVSVAPVDRAGGKTVGTVALLMDMTEAERLEQTRRDYVANVSHELRTPLASIRGIADMLNDGLVSCEEDKRRYYGYILKESIRLSTLINDLLELSRLQSGGVALKLRRFELYELIADVADRMADSASAQGMSIDLRIPEGRYYAHSNPDRVEQVLISLTDNAVKHGEPGTVSISMEEEGGKYRIGVSNPAQIDEKDLDHIFERFYKADIAHTGEGTGLGLAITEEVLRLMGESITVGYRDGVITFTFTVTKEK